MTGYDERQFVGWGIVGLSVGAILLCLAAAALVDGEMEFWLSFGGVFVWMRLTRSTLHVQDRGQQLLIRYGPFSIQRALIPYTGIYYAEEVPLLVGLPLPVDWRLAGEFPFAWYGLGGRRAVLIYLRERRRLVGPFRTRTVVVGTADVENLLEFLRGRIGTRN